MNLIDKNKDLWLNSFQYKECLSKLMNMIDLIEDIEVKNKIIDFVNKTDFLYAPGSSKFHGHYFGGLLIHVLNYYDKLINVCKVLDPNIKLESLVKVAILHDACKTNYYIPNISKGASRDMTEEELKIDRKNNPKSKKFKTHDEKITYTSDDQYMLGHAETSIIKCFEYGIKLTKQEMVMIRWHMGHYDYYYSYKSYEDKLKKSFPELKIIQFCDDFASMDEI